MAAALIMEKKERWPQYAVALILQGRTQDQTPARTDTSTRAAQEAACLQCEEWALGALSARLFCRS